MCPLCNKETMGYTSDQGLRLHVKTAHLDDIGNVKAQAKAWFKRMGYWIQDNGKPKKYTKRDRDDLVAKGFQFNEAGNYT